MRKIVGIDPGLTGAACMIDGDTESLLAVYDLEAADGVLLAGGLADRLEDWAPSLVVIEHVHSMPKQGVSSTFKFGRAFGTCEGVAATLRMPTRYISAPVWKRKLGVSRDKASARAMACRLWPQHREHFARSKDDGRAEAGLIAVALVRGTPSHA